MTGKVTVFDMHCLCKNSAIFEAIDLKLCTHIVIYQPLSFNIYSVFYFDFLGRNFQKEKKNIENSKKKIKIFKIS